MAGDKYYRAERARQAKVRQAEKELDENYKRKMQDEMDLEKYNRLFPEDSTTEYNPVEHYKNGGIARGCGKVMPNRRKVTKFY